GCNHRLGHVPQAGQDAVILVADRFQTALTAAELAHVGTGAERASAADHYKNPNGLVTLDLLQSAQQLLAQIAVDSIHPVWSVEADPADSVLDLDQHDLLDSLLRQ